MPHSQSVRGAGDKKSLAHLNYGDCQICEFSNKHQSEMEPEYGLERNEKEASSETCEKRDGKHNSC